jgi:hypothetical protein
MAIHLPVRMTQCREGHGCPGAAMYRINSFLFFRKLLID